MHGNGTFIRREEQKRDLTFRHLAFYVCKRWRLLRLAAILCAVAALILSGVRLAGELTGSDAGNPADQAYNGQLAAYDEEIQRAQTSVAALQKSLDEQWVYNRDSMLMQIDYARKTITTLAYYISVPAPAQPDDQTRIARESLMERYMLYLDGGELYAQLLARYPEMVDVAYIKEVLSAAGDMAAGVVTITVVSGDEAAAQAMLDVLKNGMAAVQTEAAEAIGDHQLSEFFYDTYTMIDMELAAQQAENIEMVYTLSGELQSKTEALNDLQAEADGLTREPLWLVVTKKLISAMVFAMLGGIAVTALAMATYYLISNRALDDNKLAYSADLDVLGTIPRSLRKKLRVWDRVAAAVGLVKLPAVSPDSALKLTAQSIYTTVLAKGLTWGGIALTGSIPVEELEALAADFNKAVALVQLPFTAVGNPMRDETSAEAIRAAAIVVIVEKQGVSLCSDIVKEVSRIDAWGKPVLGAVLLNADPV